MLDLALESIARGVADLFGFRYVTIVIADGNQTGEMTRRVMLGYPDDIKRERKNERVARFGGADREQRDEPAAPFPRQLEQDGKRCGHRAKMRQKPDVAELGAPPKVGAGKKKEQEEQPRRTRDAERKQQAPC